MKKTKKEVLEARSHLLRNAPIKAKVNKGDRRVSSPSRVCSICGTSLSSMNKITGKVKSTRAHFHLQYNKHLYIDICYMARDCYKNLKVDE